MTHDGKVTISTALDNNGFVKGVGQIKGQLGGLGGVAKKLAATIAVAFSAKAVASFAKECIDLGSDLQEVQNVVDVTFSTMNEQVDEFARNAAVTAGLSETMAKRYTGTFGAMAKAFGFAESDAYAMSTALTQLSGDVASFYNLSQSEAYTKLTAVFTGETESLKHLGVVMTQAALDSFALQKGFGKTTSEMTEQEKVALRYQFVMEQLSGASGDFLRTSDGWANQTRLLTLQFDQLKATLGQGLINALTPVIQVINELIGSLQALAEELVAVTVELFGDAGNSGSAIGGLAADYGAAAKGAEELEEANKAVKRSLAGFDQIQKIGGSSNSSSTSSAVTIPATVLPEVGDKETTKAQAVVKGFMKKVRKLLQPLLEIDLSVAMGSFRRLADAVKPLVEDAFSGLMWAYQELLVPLTAWAVEDALPAFLDGFSGALALLQSVVGALKPMAMWLWDSFLQPLAAWTGGAAVSALGAVASGLTAVSDWVSGNQGVIQSVTVAAAAFMAVWKATDLIMWIDAAGGVTRALWSLVPAIFANTAAKVASKAEDIAIIALYTKDYIVAFGKMIAQLAASTASWAANTAAKVASTAAEWAQIAATTAWNAICVIATTVTTLFGAAIAFLTSPIGLVVLAIGALIAVVVLLVKNWDTVKAFAVKAWDGIKAVWSTVAEWFRTHVTEPIGNFFKGMVNAVIWYINSYVGLLAKVVNTIIGLVNKIKIDVPDWVPGIGGETLGFNIPTITAPKIPYLAQGAVLPANKPFLAMVGDQRHGTNVEAPLATIQEAVANVMGDVVSAELAGHEATVAMLERILEAVMGIEIGDDVIGQAARRYDRKMTMIRGGV